MSSSLSESNIKVGNFFFRYRNGLFPLVYITLLLFTRPKIMFGDEMLTRFWIGTGACLALLGQAVRFFTIGFKYIERGGREGKVYATFLVQGGVYAHTRNPMYVGNGLIAIGLIMYSGSPVACAIGIPFFLFVYQAITVAEETYLRSKFGKEFEHYCATVNRFIPSFKSLFQTLSKLTFDWKRTFRKEYGTIAVVVLLLLWIPVWRSYFLHGREASLSLLPLSEALSGATMVFYVAVRLLKKSRRLESKESLPA